MLRRVICSTTSLFLSSVSTFSLLAGALYLRSVGWTAYIPRNEDTFIGIP